MRKLLKAIGCKQPTLCKCGYHNLFWYSKGDYDMYHKENRKYGPLIECVNCSKLLHIEDVNINDVHNSMLWEA